MSKKVGLILVLMIFTVIFSIFMLLIGMFLGGNFFTNLELFGARGYEAVGNLGLLFGIICGITLSVVIYWKIYNKSK